jgi:ATP phosphoribosyltransferase regulatory subunit HisZ
VPPVNIIDHVLDAIDVKGPKTVQALAVILPQFSEKQIASALKNRIRLHGDVVCDDETLIWSRKTSTQGPVITEEIESPNDDEVDEKAKPSLRTHRIRRIQRMIYELQKEFTALDKDLDELIVKGRRYDKLAQEFKRVVTFDNEVD